MTFNEANIARVGMYVMLFLVGCNTTPLKMVQITMPARSVSTTKGERGRRFLA
jgi:hypothetical protein